MYCSKGCEREANKIKTVKERDPDTHREQEKERREKQLKNVYGPVIDVSGRYGSCVFDDGSPRGTNKGLGSVNIPHPPSGDASKEEWDKYCRYLEKELRKARKKIKGMK